MNEFGYDAIKFDLDVPLGPEKDRPTVTCADPKKVGIVREVLERVGDKADVAFNCHWSFTTGSAKRLARELEPYDVWWLEDPVSPENHDVQQEVTQSMTMLITIRENVYRTHG